MVFEMMSGCFSGLTASDITRVHNRLMKMVGYLRTVGPELGSKVALFSADGTISFHVPDTAQYRSWGLV